MPEPFPVGTRLTCPQCGNQVIVVKPPRGELTCCDGIPMQPAHTKEANRVDAG